MTEKKRITVSAILADLEEGLNRKEIAVKYGISDAEVKYLFTHPKLKGKKAKKVFKPTFDIIDDTEDVQQTVEAEVENVEATDSQTPESEVQQQVEVEPTNELPFS